MALMHELRTVAGTQQLLAGLVGVLARVRVERVLPGGGVELVL